MTVEAALGWVVSAGIVSVVLGFLLKEFMQHWRENRERQALVRSLSTEIEHNKKLTDTIEARWSGRDLKNMINDPDLPSMSNDTWLNSQGKIHLLPPQLGEALHRYYSVLRTLLTLLNFARDERMNEQMNIALRNLYAEELPEQDEVRNRLMRTDPYLDALDKTLTAQNEARQELDEYLNRRSWWRRFLRLLARSTLPPVAGTAGGNRSW